jgi:hypothetical protein
MRRSEAPHSKEFQRSHVSQKLYNPPCSELTIKGERQVMQKVFVA